MYLSAFHPDGKVKAMFFLKLVERFINNNFVSSDTKILYVVRSLIGESETWARNDLDKWVGYTEFKKDFLAKYWSTGKHRWHSQMI